MEYRVSLSGESPFEKPFRDMAGVGLLRGEFILRGCGRCITDLKAISELQGYVHDVCRAFAGRPVWYRMCDIWSDEANILEGNLEFEYEQNPLLGIRGIERTLRHKPALNAELGAIVELAYEHKNLHIMTPFVHDAKEFELTIKQLELIRWPNRIGSMVEIPSVIFEAGRLVELGASNLLIGLNDLTCLLLGKDRGPSELKLHPTVWRAIDYFKSIVPTNVEWGIGGSLSVDLVSKSESSGAVYTTIHYAEIPSILDYERNLFSDLDYVRNIKTKNHREKRLKLKQYL